MRRGGALRVSALERSLVVRNFRAKAIFSLVIAAAALAFSAVPASADDVIYACINKSTGNARLAQPTTGAPLTATSVCTAVEFPTKMFWNQTGPQGPQGAQGPQGI